MGAGAAMYRVIVLVVTTDPIRAEGLGDWDSRAKPASPSGLSQSIRKRRWYTDPKLTVLVYEFRRRDAGSPLVLSRTGIGAKEHVVGAGLWTARQLR